MPVLMCGMSWILCTLVSPNSWDHSDGLASAKKLHVVTCNFFHNLWLHFGLQNPIHSWEEKFKRNANTSYTQCMIVLKNRQIPQKSWSISSCAPPIIRYLKVVCEKSYFQLEMSKLQETKGFKPEWKLMHLVWIEKIWDGSFRRFANIVITLGKTSSRFISAHCSVHLFQNIHSKQITLWSWIHSFKNGSTAMSVFHQSKGEERKQFNNNNLPRYSQIAQTVAARLKGLLRLMLPERLSQVWGLSCLFFSVLDVTLRRFPQYHCQLH